MNTNKSTFEKTINTKWRWEQDGGGGEHGILTIWPDTTNEISITMGNFKSSFELMSAIDSAMDDAFEKGQRLLASKLLDQIEDFVM